MSAHKNIDKICEVVLALTLVIALVFCCGSALGIETTAHAIGYEDRLFDRSRVHTIDIVMDDWDEFIENCESEEYSPCSLVIDGEAVKNVGIRGKGNTSLSSVRNTGSSRYSFKIEFDQYDSTKSYHGLDKLCLNNLIQDNTYMKDYLAYTMMYDFGVDAPLCSYAYITVNGEDWGLYLAVEAVEESFLERNYGSNYGDLYKPDSMSFGGGRGNGRDFSMSDFMNENSEDSDSANSINGSDSEKSSTSGFTAPGGFSGGNMPEGMEPPEGFDPSQMGVGNMPDFGGEMPEGFNAPDGSAPTETSDNAGRSRGMGGFGGFGGFGGGGMGTDDVKLKYIDDNASSYSNIFGSAKTTVNTADENRLIRSLKALSEQSDLESTLDINEVLRYFAVHIFLCNGDSYTGQMIHNYYLYEEDGQLSMIPWDYNLAFGSFSGGSASSSVNSPIDTPVSGDMSDRPMVSWIFSSDEYTEQYHELLSEFIGSANISQRIEETAALIDEYVQKDPTSFCTYDEYLKGVEAIKEFCELRTESVQGQLDGTIPSTTDGQTADSSSLIDASSLTISDMGTMNNGKGGGFSGARDSSDKTAPEASGNSFDSGSGSTADKAPASSSFGKPEAGSGITNAAVIETASSRQSDGTMPNFGGGQMPEGMEPPDDFDPSQMFGGQPPQGMGGQAPGGFGGQLPDNSDGQSAGGFGGQLPDSSDSQSSGDIGGQVPEGLDGQSGNSSGGNLEKPSAQLETNDAAGRSSRQQPQPGDFSSMNTRQNDKTQQLILLIVSAVVLAGGIVFAKLFKR